MLEIEHLTLDRLPETMDPKEIRDRHNDKIAQAAQALADAALRITVDIDGVNDSQYDSERFRGLSGQLHREALTLRGLAEAGKIENARDALEPILGVCNDCHDTFRGDPITAVD